MENLPPEITRDILSRLPVESILECRRVCKPWRSLIYNPDFVHMHLCRLFGNTSIADKVGLLFLIEKKKEGKKLYYGDYDEKDDQSCKNCTMINLIQPPVDMACIVGSCNGLICISTTHGITVDDPVYICNPITRECLNLPRFKTNTIAEGRMVSGFGYHSSTNEYKVVRIFYNFRKPGIGRIQVYTLGNGSGWRDIGEISYPLEANSRPAPQPGTLANGVLHWVDYLGNIFAFDLADEKFRVVPPPPCFRFGEYNYFQIKELGGWLSVFYHNFDDSLDVWSLKKKNISNQDMREHEYYKFWSWNKVFSVKDASMYREDYCPLQSGNILTYRHSTLSGYDPNTNTKKPVVKFDRGLSIIKVIPCHMKSFVSLKALGEDDTKIIS